MKLPYIQEVLTHIINNIGRLFVFSWLCLAKLQQGSIKEHHWTNFKQQFSDEIKNSLLNRAKFYFEASFVLGETEGRTQQDPLVKGSPMGHRREDPT